MYFKYVDQPKPIREEMRLYDRYNLVRVIQSVLDDGSHGNSVRGAAKMNAVSYTTLSHRVMSRVPIDAKNPGSRPTIKMRRASMTNTTRLMSWQKPSPGPSFDISNSNSYRLR
jgi:hypothetical protein